MRTGSPVPQGITRISYRVNGFAYVLLLVAISVIGIVAGATLSLGSQLARRDAEQSLLVIGMEFQQALRSYAAVPVGATDITNARGPRALEELLKDPRVPSTRRHLRQIYADPMTGRDAWGLIRDPSGYILAIYSLSDSKPIKQTGFAPTQAGFEEATTYAAWIFGLPNAQLLIKNPANSTL